MQDRQQDECVTSGLHCRLQNVDLWQRVGNTHLQTQDETMPGVYACCRGERMRAADVQRKVGESRMQKELPFHSKRAPFSKDTGRRRLCLLDEKGLAWPPPKQKREESMLVILEAISISARPRVENLEYGVWPRGRAVTGNRREFEGGERHQRITSSSNKKKRKKKRVERMQFDISGRVQMRGGMQSAIHHQPAWFFCVSHQLFFCFVWAIDTKTAQVYAESRELPRVRRCSCRVVKIGFVWTGPDLDVNTEFVPRGHLTIFREFPHRRQRKVEVSRTSKPMTGQIRGRLLEKAANYPFAPVKMQESMLRGEKSIVTACPIGR